MSNFSIDNLLNSVGQIQNDNEKVFINASDSKLEVSNTSRSIFKKAQSAALNEKSKNTLSILKAALESSLNAKGLEIYNRFITGKKAQGTQRLTVADFKAIKTAVDRERSIIESKQSGINSSFIEKLNLARILPNMISAADNKFKELDKNSLSNIRFLLNEYKELKSDLESTQRNVGNANELRANIDDKIDKLQSMINSRANTYENFSSSFNLKIDSIVQSANTLVDHLTSKIEDLEGQNPKLARKYQGMISKLDTVSQKYKDIKAEFNKTANLDIMKYTEVPTKYFEIFKTALSDAKKDLEDILKSAGYPNKNLVKDTYNTALSKESWHSLKNDVEVTFKDDKLKLKSNIIPVHNLQNSSVNYGRGINGIPCSATTSPHLTNFCKTQLTSNDEEQPKVLFEGYRHGVVDAYDVEDHNTRVQYNNQKAMEFLTTVVGDKYSNAILQGQGSSENNPIKLTINSLSLLTPMSGLDGEMQENHAAALKALDHNGRPYSINVKVNGHTRTVYVQPTVNTYAFSTNLGGHGFGLFSKKVWHNGNSKYNNDGFNAMFGNDVKTKPSRNEKLQSNMKDLNVYSFEAFKAKFRDDAHKNTSLGKFLETASPADQRKAYILYSEIQLLKQNRRYQDQGADLFALPARMAMLSHLTGEITSFNCKSGKDRTGMLDVRVKALAARMDTVNENFDPEKYLKNESSIVKSLVKKEQYNDDDRKNVTSIAQDGGNLEIQQYNTGIKGSKVHDIQGIVDAFTDKDAFKLNSGMSKYAKS